MANLRVTKETMCVEKGSSSPLSVLNGMVIPKGTPVRQGRYKWNKDTYFISDFDWLPGELKNNNFFMGDLANYGITVSKNNIIEVNNDN